MDRKQRDILFLICISCLLFGIALVVNCAVLHGTHWLWIFLPLWLCKVFHNLSSRTIAQHAWLSRKGVGWVITSATISVALILGALLPFFFYGLERSLQFAVNLLAYFAFALFLMFTGWLRLNIPTNSQEKDCEEPT